jgi:hypothetical protein
MIGCPGQEPDQQAATSNNDQNDIEKYLSIKKVQEQSQDKKGHCVADKMPDVQVEKIGQGNPYQSSSGTRDNPITIQADRQDQVYKVDCPDRADKIGWNCSRTEFHGYSSGILKE